VNHHEKISRFLSFIREEEKNFKERKRDLVLFLHSSFFPILTKHQLLTRTCLNCEASLGGKGELMAAWVRKEEEKI